MVRCSNAVVESPPPLPVKQRSKSVMSQHSHSHNYSSDDPERSHQYTVSTVALDSYTRPPTKPSLDSTFIHTGPPSKPPLDSALALLTPVDIVFSQILPPKKPPLYRSIISQALPPAKPPLTVRISSCDNYGSSSDGTSFKPAPNSDGKLGYFTSSSDDSRSMSLGDKSATSPSHVSSTNQAVSPLSGYLPTTGQAVSPLLTSASCIATTTTSIAPPLPMKLKHSE